MAPGPSPLAAPPESGRTDRAAYAAAIGELVDGPFHASLAAVLPEQEVFAVADGVTGVTQGQQAARFALEAFGTLLSHGERLASMSPQKVDPLALAMLGAHEAVAELGSQHPMLAGETCCFAALQLRGDHAVVVHTGDCRVYRLSGGHLERLTRDHTLDETPWVLTQALGAELESLELRQCECRAGDTFVLCSRGVADCASEEALAQVLSQHTGDMADACERIMQAAADGYGQLFGVSETDRVDELLQDRSPGLLDRAMAMLEQVETRVREREARGLAAPRSAGVVVVVQIPLLIVAG